MAISVHQQHCHCAPSACFVQVYLLVCMSVCVSVSLYVHECMCVCMATAYLAPGRRYTFPCSRGQSPSPYSLWLTSSGFNVTTNTSANIHQIISSPDHSTLVVQDISAAASPNANTNFVDHFFCTGSLTLHLNRISKAIIVVHVCAAFTIARISHELFNL